MNDKFMNEYRNIYKIKGDSNDVVHPDFEVPVSLYRSDSNNAVPGHKHDFFEIVYINQGHSIHILDGKPNILMPGDVFVIIPGETHQYVNLKNTEKYDCLVSLDAINELPPSIFSLYYIGSLLKGIRQNDKVKVNLPIKFRKYIKELLDKIIMELLYFKDESNALINAYLVEFLIAIARGSQEGKAVMENTKKSYTKKVMNAMIYISENLESQLTVNEIASAAGMNCDYFTRVFCIQAGMTPSEYIHMVKISKAVEMLYNTDCTISDISFYTGFSDRNYFSRLFKKVTGRTPSEYKKLISS